MLKGRTVTHITGYDAACVLALGSTLPVEEPALDFCCQSVFTTEVNKAVGNQDSNDMVVDSTATRIITNRDRGGIRWLEVSTDIIMNRYRL